MKIVRFLGGLGNQMFQYAFYKSLEQTGIEVKADLNEYRDYPLHNGFELETLFGIHIKKVGPFTAKLYDSSNREWHLRKLRRLLGLKKAYYEQQTAFHFDSSVYLKKPGLYWGYWQNISYVEPVAVVLRKDFKFIKTLSPGNMSVLDEIKAGNSVSIHIRRGDYLNDPLLGGICGVEYYQKAVDIINQLFSGIRFYVFSDDIKWCETNLCIPDAVYIKGNSGADSYVDMQLMSHCNHHIIANSSFSWWGAWLNNNSGKVVIAPAKWVNIPSINTNNITPSSWIRI